VGKPCIICDRPCESLLDFWETPDDGLTNAIHLRCQAWLMDHADLSAGPSVLPALRKIIAAKEAV
jgi:hypothetical protein